MTPRYRTSDEWFDFMLRHIREHTPWYAGFCAQQLVRALRREGKI